ncbi:MAG: AAA family ATPase, partial [Planctomycetota bacterium]
AAEDVRAVVKPVMRHRIFTNFNADAESITPDRLITMLVDAVGEPSIKDYAGSAGA